MSTNQSLVRADGLYFTDCGLVIQAETTLFRISRDFLAIHSAIFRDMLTLPTPSEAETLDGALVVRLPDSAQDIDTMLRALLYSDFFLPPPLPTSLDNLTRIMRMSHKYDIDILRKRALAHLDAIHPMTLDAYEALPLRTSTWVSDRPTGKSCLAMILLAREFSLDWILPFAFYRVCVYATDLEIIESTLALIDKAAIVTGCRLLQGNETHRLMDVLSEENDFKFCEDPGGCAEGRDFVREMVESQRFITEQSHALGQSRYAVKSDLPLEVWTQRIEPAVSGRDSNMCMECGSQLSNEFAVYLKDFWRNLPQIFGLPDWQNLQDAKKTALTKE
ncbi:BTB domain-containing protein [Mycena indigotica]|uniref:BTB domain-containing protein n=1 Tax=Mycena indigotica TaxID=2126181 RepID=A0A8H6S277_9AGAR|nr:BTB domain-containing protein [Mycena indigotica]KAF7290696.1 BTB domain-containing protein [Mycena indigotica]